MPTRTIMISCLRLLCLIYFALIVAWWNVPLAAAQSSLPTDYHAVNVGAGCTFADALQLTLVIRAGTHNGCTLTTIGTPAAYVARINLPTGTHQLPAIDTTGFPAFSLFLVGSGGAAIQPVDNNSNFLVQPGSSLHLHSTTWRNFASAMPALRPIENRGTLTIADSTFSNMFGPSAGILYNTGTATITGSTFTGNSSNFLGIFFNSGTMSITNSTFTGNTGGSEGVLENTGTLTISGSRFADNIGDDTGTMFSNGTLTITGSAFINNSNASVNHGGLHIGGGSASITGSCLVGNVIAVSAVVNVTATNNWWGTTTGPSGYGTGRGDRVTANVTFDPFRRSVPPSVADCPSLTATAADDLMTMILGDGGPVPGPRSVLANDVEVDRAILFRDATSGEVDLNEQTGEFTYTLTAPAPPRFDYFSYQATAADSSLTVIAAVCLTFGDLLVEVPGQQETDQNVPIPIPGVSIQSTTTSPDTLVTVTLRVSDGTLDVGNYTSTDEPDIIRARCQQLIDNGGDPTVPPPSSAASDTVQHVSFRESRAASVILQASVPVDVRGDGSAEVTLEGSRADVNYVLETLVYTPNNSFAGVDHLVIVAVQQGIVANNSVRIVVLGGESVAANTEGGLLSLNDLCHQPLTIICAEVPPNTVTNGDVFVRIIAGYGEFLTNADELGDGALLQMGLIHSAEVFGMTFGGVPVAAYNNTILVCLRGEGNFFFRDATGIPRTTQQLATTPRGDFTCAVVPNSGTVILVSGGTGLSAAPQPAGEQALIGCSVTLTNRLNLREQPDANSSVIRLMPFDITLTAIARRGEWFYVDYLGTFGWAHGQYLRLNGACGS